MVRQKRVKGSGRPIDFYIESIDTYVQFDGVYWHGLDRPIELIEERKNSHDQEIADRWHKDREQDEWFKAKGLKLVRITDQVFDEKEAEDIIKRILS